MLRRLTACQLLLARLDMGNTGGDDFIPDYAIYGGLIDIFIC